MEEGAVAAEKVSVGVENAAQDTADDEDTSAAASIAGTASAAEGSPSPANITFFPVDNSGLENTASAADQDSKTEKNLQEPEIKTETAPLPEDGVKAEAA